MLSLKKEISQVLNVPVPKQKILCVGRTLADEKTLNSYPTIKDGTKLTVVIKEPEPLKDVMNKIFKKFYSEEQADAMTKEFMIDFDNRLSQMSLDDIERMATHFMDRDKKLYGESSWFKFSEEFRDADQIRLILWMLRKICDRSDAKMMKEKEKMVMETQ